LTVNVYNITAQHMEWYIPERSASKQYK